MTATFMPKPFTDRTGSGLHLHLSLWRGRRGAVPGDRRRPDGLGLCPLAYSFIGGILEHAPALQAVLAPTVNSYKRTGATTSGRAPPGRRGGPPTAATTAPTCIRVPGRQPDRAPRRRRLGQPLPRHRRGARRRAGRRSSRGLDPGDPGRRAQQRPRCRRRCCTRSKRCAADPVILAALERPTRAWPSYFADVKDEEFLEWHNQVSDWEVHSYLTSF